MNSRNESKMNMYLATKDYLSNHEDILTPLPMYSVNYALFINNIAKIQTNSAIQIINKTGIAIDKNNVQIKLISEAVNISRKLIAYATLADNQILLKEVRYSESSLKKSSDNELVDKCKNLYNIANTNIDALANYGITATSLTAYQSIINEFINVIPRPRLGIAARKQSTQLIEEGINEADNALKNIDVIIEIIRDTQTNFYLGYKSVRNIIELGKNSIILKGKITDENKNLPIKNAIITFTGNSIETEGITLIKTSSVKGGFNINTMTEGMYSVTIEKIGYETQNTSIAIINGETANLNIALKEA